MASSSVVPPAPDGLTSNDFPVLWPVGTRWADNDMFGHLNNAVYYQLFDTAINAWINTEHRPGPDHHARAGHRRRIGLPLLLRTAFPAAPCGRTGGHAARARSSVTYRLGVFRAAGNEPPTMRRSPSPRSGTGCTSTSTGPPASRSRFPTPIRALLATAVRHSRHQGFRHRRAGAPQEAPRSRLCFARCRREQDHRGGRRRRVDHGDRRPTSRPTRSGTKRSRALGCWPATTTGGPASCGWTPKYKACRASIIQAVYYPGREPDPDRHAAGRPVPQAGAAVQRGADRSDERC